MQAEFGSENILINKLPKSPGPKIVILGVLQQQAEALGTQFPPIYALFNKNDWNTNKGEMISSDRVIYIPYFAVNFWQEAKYQLMLIQQINPDIIYINSMRQLIMIGLFIRLIYIFRKRPKVIATSHNSIIWNSTNKRKLISLVFNLFSDGILALAKFQEQILIDNGVKKSKIQTISNAIDIEQFFPTLSGSSTIQKNNPILINIGEQNPLKNQETLFRALAIVKKEFPEIKLILAGGRIPDPDYAIILKKLIDELLIQENIINLGYLQHQEIPDLLRKSDIFVFASLSEVCPFVILESLACGLVTISTSVGGVPDLIQDGENGFLIKPGDHSAFADCIKKALIDSELREKIKKNARKSAEENFSYKAIGEKHKQFILEIVNEKF